MEIIEQLKISKSQIPSYFDLPHFTHKYTYAEGKWNIRQLLVHIADAESVLYDRIRRTIAEQPKPVVWSFNQDGWAAHFDYDHFPIESSKKMFDGIRDGIIHLAERYYISHGDLPFVHSEAGLRTLKDEIDKVVWHCQHHLDQIKKALELNEFTI